MKKYKLELFLFVILIYLELLFQVIIFKEISIDFMYPILFNLSFAFFVGFICRCFHYKVNKILSCILLFLICLLFIVEMIYFDVFDTFVSIYSILNVSKVFGEFKDLVLDAIVSNLHIILLCLCPFILYVYLFRNEKLIGSFKRNCLSLIFSFLFYWISFMCLLIPHSGFEKTLNIYLDNQPTEVMMQRFGCITSFRNQIREQFYVYKDTRNVKISMPLPKEDENDYGFNMMDIDFKSLIDSETNPTIKKMHQYFSTLTPTSKNEYTGMFEGYNLIMITAEAFSDYAIDEELTPTLYKMKNEGFIFNNFYNPIFGVSTSDGEYVNNFGLYPKEGVWSFSESSDNSVPFTFGWQYQSLGIETYAYHNHTYSYYNRDESHTHVWENYKGLGNGLNVKKTWPESDLEMIQLTSEEYMSQEAFHTYFMSVSGHKNYDWIGNSMSYKNKSYVEHLDLDEFSKGYLAANIEFDRAMEQLLIDLEKYGHAENTLIVIAPDHYPYGLEEENIEELSGREIEDEFDLYKSVWIIYSPSMSEPIEVDTYCSSVDILPNVSNLLGLEYDSRLLAGVDVFSDVEPIVALKDRSFMTKDLKYLVKSDEILFSDHRISDSKIQSYYNTVKQRFEMSAKILEEDYYKSIFGK